MDVPETRYAISSDGSYIAYQVFGDGPVDLLYLPGFASHLEVYWEHPLAARFLRRLGGIARTIVFDKRGTGLSDRVTSIPDLDTMMDDVRAVLDAAGWEQAVLWGDGPDGGGASAVYAASFPDRVKALVWWQPSARSRWAPDYPWGEQDEHFAAEAELYRVGWGTERSAPEILRILGAPSIADDPDSIRWCAKFCRYSATPGAAITLARMWAAVDVRGVLPAIQVPTLLVSRTDLEPPGEEARHLASLIPGAKVALLSPAPDFPPWLGDLDGSMSAVQAFLGSVREEEEEFDRVLATVLFTDIVGSTARAAELGDRAWRELLERHHATVRGLLARYRGTEVDTAGDGFLATFEGPVRGVRCAQAIVEAVRSLGIEVRAGLHTGEVETIDSKVGGIAVNIGSRVGALAGPSDVLVSQTVKDLVVGSGLAFENAGEHELKGVPDRWRLYRVVTS